MTEETLYRKVGDQFVPVEPMRPQVTRTGQVHEFKLGMDTVFITVNKDPKTGKVMEIFGKSDGGFQGHLDQVCTAISLSLQGRGDIETFIRHLRYDRTEPCGGPGQPSSCYDGLASILAEASGVSKHD